MRDFRKLKVWEKAHETALMISAATKTFPREERYGLTSQIRRAAVSNGENIVEGNGRGSDVEMGRLLWIALGSAGEPEHDLLLASDLGYLDNEDSERITLNVAKVKRMLTIFIQKLKADS